MIKQKPTLEDFRKADPKGYATLCEQQGCKEEALKYYASSKDPYEVLHAAEIAIGIQHYGQAKRLLAKTLEFSKKRLARAEEALKEAQKYDIGIMGAGMGCFSAEESNKRIKQQVSELEAKLK